MLKHHLNTEPPIIVVELFKEENEMDKFIDSGVYEPEELMETIKNEVEKNKWFDMNFVFMVMDDNSMVVDTLSIKPMEIDEATHEKWIKGFKEWEKTLGKKGRFEKD